MKKQDVGCRSANDESKGDVADTVFHINTLPPELLGEIFQRVFAHAHFTARQYHEQLQQLLRVCQYWLTVLIGNELLLKALIHESLSLSTVLCKFPQTH